MKATISTGGEKPFDDIGMPDRDKQICDPGL
jgi:hypothetical protein